MPFEKSKTYCPRQRDGSFSPPAAGIDWAMPDMSSVIEPRRRALSIAPEPVNWSEPATPGALIVAVSDMCVVETREVFVAAAATGSNDCETVSLVPQAVSAAARRVRKSGKTNRRIRAFFGVRAQKLQFEIPRRGARQVVVAFRSPVDELGFGSAPPSVDGTSPPQLPQCTWPRGRLMPRFSHSSRICFSISLSYSAYVITSSSGGAAARTSMP